VPRREGCSATYQCVDNTAGTWKTSFAIFGLGGSELATFEQEQMTEVIADKSCVEVVQHGHVKIETGKVLFNGHEVSLLGVVVTVTDIDKIRMIFRVLDPAVDGCQVPPGSLTTLQTVSPMNLLRTYDLRSLPATSSPQAMSFKLTSKLELSTDLAPKLGPLADYVSISLTTTQASEESLEIAYKLSPGAVYYPYQPAGGGSLEVCWTTDPADKPGSGGGAKEVEA
jgi:hypothetical protein